MTIKIIEKSPARVEFISGGDHKHYIEKMGWGACLNATISLYASCEINKASITSFDKLDDMLRFFIQYYNTTNVKVKTYQTFPKAAGLGGSASHAVAIIKAFDKLHGIKRTKQNVALFAYDVERTKLGIDGGYQDQFATVYGGFNYMVFKKNSVSVNSLSINSNVIKELEKVSLMIHIPREVVGHSIQKDMKWRSTRNIGIMREKREICKDGRDALLDGDIENFINFVKKDWELRKKESPLVENKKTRKIEKLAYDGGASVCKFLGSGSGGCAIIFSDNKERVAEILKGKAELLDFRFEVCL